MSKRKFTLEFELFCNEELGRTEEDEEETCEWRVTDEETTLAGYGQTIRSAFTDYLDDVYDTINDPTPAAASWQKTIDWLKERFAS